MESKGIGCGAYYSRSLTQQKSFEIYSPNACPNAERLAGEVLSLPLYPELTDRECEVVIDTLKQCLTSI